MINKYASFVDEMIKIAAFKPLLGLGAAGAGIGGLAGAATARPGEERWRAALRGAGWGAGAGMLGGAVAGKGMAKGLAATKTVAPRRTAKEVLTRTPKHAPTTVTDPAMMGEALKRIGTGVGVGTLGAAGAGVVGSRVAPAVSGYMQQRGGGYGGRY